MFRAKYFLSGLMLLVMALGPGMHAAETACARKICSGGGTMCSQPLPAGPCMSGMPPGTDCVCYTDFTMQFAQTVHVSAENIDTDCGGGRSGFFIIRHTDWTEAYAYDMGGPAMNWSSDQPIAAGTYRLEPSTQWGGTYCVQYASGPPNCSGTLTAASTGFGSVNDGACSADKTLTFTNTGNIQFTMGGITTSDPNFTVDPGGAPAILGPGDHFTFKVKFCPTTGGDKSTLITVNYTCNATPQARQLTLTGTGHVPQGYLSVTSPFDVGTADWTLPPPGNHVDRNLQISNTGDAPMTVNVILTNDGGGVFSLPNGGNVGIVNATSSKNVLVRATVSAETSYTGSLTVQANYGAAGSDTASVTLNATGHHPVSHLTLDTLDIDYHEVEVDYSFRQAICIRNTGDAPLTFQTRLQDPADPDLPEFTLDTGDKGPLAPGGPYCYEMTYHPSTSGPKDVFVIVDHTNEPIPTTNTVRLHGEGTTPLPLSTMLVLDRSGSMSAMAGDVVKIQALSDSGVLYTELARDEWDWLGITRACSH